MRRRVKHPILFTLACATLFWSSWAAVISASRLMTVYVNASDFLVVRSYEDCEQPNNNRCDRDYVVRDEIAGSESDLVPFGGQFPLDPLPDDLHIRKAGYSFTYELDGEREAWPSLKFYAFVLTCGLLVIGGWFYLGGLSFIKECLESDDEDLFAGL